MDGSINAMLDVCRKHSDPAPTGVVVPEPYLPYLPSGWNNVLVLAEAQQLASTTKYVNWLKSLPPEDRMRRLSLSNPCKHSIGVGPWDDGIVKLAVKAMMPDIRLDDVAVGNAVPWSCCTERGTNANPTDEMQQRSVSFWRDLLAVWQPEFQPLILLGKIGANVMAGAGIKNAVKLRLPSPNNIQRICGMFDQEDLLGRFPEVHAASVSLGIPLTHSNVFFACHAVSLGRRQLHSNSGGH